MTEFHSQLINKARHLFPSLRDIDLSRYLQHSRSTSAYDAVMLLFSTLHEAYKSRTTPSDPNSTIPSEVALQLLAKTMVYTYLRII